MPIVPVNNHLLIEPVKHETFIASDKGTCEEIGVVLAVDDRFTIDAIPGVSVGDKVYFDSWMCAKYPKNDEEFYWLVPWSEVRAIQHAEVPA